MPEQSRADKLRADLKHHFIDTLGVKTRKTREGIMEHVIPEGFLQDILFSIVPERSLAYSLPGYRNMPSTNIYREQADSPEVQQHERIHSGQHLLGGRLNWREAQKIFPREYRGVDTANPDYEIPAYAIAGNTRDSISRIIGTLKPGEAQWVKWLTEANENKMKNEQFEYNRWMDYVNRMFPETADVAEAPMPLHFQINRIHNYPEKNDPAYVPQIPRPRVPGLR